MFPEFPSSETSVETAAFIHDNVVLIDSSPGKQTAPVLYFMLSVYICRYTTLIKM